MRLPQLVSIEQRARWHTKDVLLCYIVVLSFVLVWVSKEQWLLAFPRILPSSKHNKTIPDFEPKIATSLAKCRERKHDFKTLPFLCNLLQFESLLTCTLIKSLNDRSSFSLGLFFNGNGFIKYKWFNQQVTYREQFLISNFRTCYMQRKGQ